MNARSTLTVLFTVAALAAFSGCAVTRGQETVGAYIDDSALTTAVKARFIDNKDVDASAISVETMKGTVMLSGFAKSEKERVIAENITRGVKGVMAVKNQVVVRP